MMTGQTERRWEGSKMQSPRNWQKSESKFTWQHNFPMIELTSIARQYACRKSFFFPEPKKVYSWLYNQQLWKLHGFTSFIVGIRQKIKLHAFSRIHLALCWFKMTFAQTDCTFVRRQYFPGDGQDYYNKSELEKWLYRPNCNYVWPKMTLCLDGYLWKLDKHFKKNIQNLTDCKW